MFLNNSTIRLRALEPEDLDLLYKWENQSGIWIHGNTLSPYSRFALRQYINDTQQTDIYEAKQLRLMIDLIEKNLTIGTVDIYDFNVRNNHAGVGILIDEEFRNKHYATQTLDLIKDYAFNFLGLAQLYAYISTENKTSLRLFTNAGYCIAGILKSWTLVNEEYVDVQIVQLIKK